MKTVATQVRSAIRSSYDLVAVPRLVADWNMNRYVETTVDNTPTEDSSGNDVENFPIETIVGPHRPKSQGIAKARVGQAKVNDGFVDPNEPRFYVAGVDSKYKYWQNPTVSDASGNITGVLPAVIYSDLVDVNKLLVRFENSWASPVQFTIQTSVDGTNWVTVSTNPTIANDGSVTLYYNGTTWVTTRPATFTSLKTLKGLRISVTKLGPGRRKDGAILTYKDSLGVTTNTTGANSFFSLIEMGLHREVDLSDYVVTTEDTFDTSDVSMLYPIGSLTTNTSSVVLWNGDGTFNKDNPDSPYKDLLEPNVEMNLEYVYTVNGVDYPVQQWRLVTQNWAGQKEATATVSLGDDSTWLQETTPNPAMWEDMSLTDIVYRLCDSVGFSSYNIVSHPSLTDYVIPVFYVTGEESVWEVFDQLAKATQSAIYFDAYGIMQVKTREAAFDTTRPVDWVLRGVNKSGELADIVEMGQTEEYNNNVVRVSYEPAAWSDWNGGLPAMQTVWEPEDVAVLRAAELTADLTDDDVVEGVNQFIKLKSIDAVTWPYEGLVNIEGELIRYKGKELIYYTDTLDGSGNLVTYAGTRNTVIVNDADELKKYNEMIDEGFRYKNHFSGNMLITVRGEWNSEIAEHLVDTAGYTVRSLISGTRRVGLTGFKHEPRYSSVKLFSNSRIKRHDDMTLATKGAPDDLPWRRFGTRVKFSKGSAFVHNQAGIVLYDQGSGESGYFIELTPTSKLGGSTRAKRNELIVFGRKNGNQERYASVPLAIAEGIDYDIDANVFLDGTKHQINIWINGLRVAQVTIPTANTVTQNGRFGMFIRGKTEARFDYLYALARQNIPDIPDDFTYLDKIQGGYVGDMFRREWVYYWKTYTYRQKKKTLQGRQRFNQSFFDEFGPVVHEIREYDVKFDPAPVLHNRLYMTNDWSAICTEYRSNPFGAKFILANTSRDNAVINGEETLNYAGSSKSVNHVLNVIGRTLVTSDAVEVVTRNEKQIRARGEIEVIMDSQWIQTQPAAQALADWIAAHWGDGTDDQSADIFGNPLIEVGDVVAVDNPLLDMTEAEAKYFVTGVSTSFESGLTTTLTLRRMSQ